MFNNSYICALDIGSSKIVAAVAKVKKKHITNIFFEAVISKGVKEGTIVDSTELVARIGSILKRLKTKSGVNIKSVFVNISGQDIVTKHSHAIIPLAERGNKVITVSDLQKVNKQARILGSSLEEEIVHQIPLSYSIDTKNNLLNPLGLYSHRLEVDLYLIYANLSSVQSLSHAINQAGYELKDLFLSGIATGSVVFGEELKKGINILCDMGSDATELLIFRDGLLHNIEILPLGGNELTSRLSAELKIPFDLAEDVKRSYASVWGEERISEDKEILLKKDSVYKPIKQRLVNDIVSAKTKLICAQIKDILEKSVSLNEVDNFVTTGRTVLLTGFLEMLEAVLGIPVKLGRIRHPEIIPFINKSDTLSGQKYLGYLTCLGIICQALYEDQPQLSCAPETTHNPILKVINRIKDIYQEYF